MQSRGIMVRGVSRPSPYVRLLSAAAESGRSHHAGRASATEWARFRTAALEIDSARATLGGDDPGAAFALWQALVSEAWLAVDWFDWGGRRFVLAKRNHDCVVQPPGLTLQEARVVAQAALGETNKIIAHGLGLSRSRVSCLLRSAMGKLGVKSRAQLVLLMRGLHPLAESSRHGSVSASLRAKR